LIEIERVRAAQTALLARICTPAEQAYCLQRHDPAASLAARWAAKEAVAKALGCGIGAQARFLEIEVLVDAQGAPQLCLHGQTLAHAQSLGLNNWQVSLSHTASTAAAMVLGC